MSELKQPQQQESGKSVLEAIKGLRYCTEDEGYFWSTYLGYISVLSKSPLVLHVVRQEEQWHIVHEYSSDTAITATPDPLLALRIMQNGFAFERYDGSCKGFSMPYLVGARLDSEDGGDDSLLLFLLDKSNGQQFNDLVIRIQLVTDIPFHYYRPSQQNLPELSVRPAERLLAHVIDIGKIVSGKEKFLLACMTLVNEVAFRFECSQVSIGWVKNDYIRVVAISNRESFERQSEVISDLEAVYEETFDQATSVTWPPRTEFYAVHRAHSSYCSSYKLSYLLSVPLMVQGVVVAVIVLERKNGEFENGMIEATRILAEQVSPWLDMLHHKSRWIGVRLTMALNRGTDSLFSVEHSLIKLICAILLAVSLYLCFGEMEYSIEGSASLKTDAVGYLAAPFDGIISDVKVHEGESIQQNAVLIKIDTRELVLKAAQSSADIARYTRESEKNRAHDALADMKISQSRVDESQAELSRVQQYLGQAELKSPFAGVVVEGDNKKLLGAPVSKGDVLLKIARIDAMYLTVKIHERDIGEFRVHDKGRLTLLGRPGDTFPITVNQIIPMAEIDQKDGNIFVLKADINYAPQGWWRPGMSGVAKIDVGKRRVAWVISHRLIDFIRMQLWW